MPSGQKRLAILCSSRSVIPQFANCAYIYVWHLVPGQQGHQSTHVHMCVCVGDLKQFNMTSPPKQADRHHTHMHDKVQGTMCVDMHCKTLQGSDLDIEGGQREEEGYLQ